MGKENVGIIRVFTFRKWEKLGAGSVGIIRGFTFRKWGKEGAGKVRNNQRFPTSEVGRRKREEE
jgi:hypothetical protein